MNTREQVLAILKEVKPTKNLETVSDIIEGGFLDSFELMSLVMKLEETFGIDVSIDDLVPENFNSATAIATMIENLKR